MSVSEQLNAAVANLASPLGSAVRLNAAPSPLKPAAQAAKLKAAVASLGSPLVPPLYQEVSGKQLPSSPKVITITREKETPKPKSDQSGNAGKTITKVEEPLFSEKTKELLRAMAKLLRTMVIAAVVAIVVLALLAIFLGVNVLTGGGLAIAIFLVLGTAIAAGLVHSLWK